MSVSSSSFTRFYGVSQKESKNHWIVICWISWLSFIGFGIVTINTPSSNSAVMPDLSVFFGIRNCCIKNCLEWLDSPLISFSALMTRTFFFDMYVKVFLVYSFKGDSEFNAVFIATLSDRTPSFFVIFFTCSLKQMLVVHINSLHLIKHVLHLRLKVIIDRTVCRAVCQNWTW